MRRLLTSALIALTVVGCKSGPKAAGESCEQKADCAEGLDCVDDVCVASEAERSSGPSYCETVAAMAGTWTFDTTVIGAEDLAPRGINGHYTLEVTADGCTANVHLTKTGHDDIVYTEKKIQTSDAALAESKSIPHAAEATFSLKGKPTHTMTFVVRDGQLFGHWQSSGSEWTRAGMWGFLRGVQAGQELAKVEDFSVQPCEVACLTQCDAARRRSDASLDEPALAACMTACGGDQPIVGCGPGKPLPAELTVAISGPAESIDALCTKLATELVTRIDADVPATAVTCDRKPPVNDKPAARSLGKGPLNGSFKSAELIQLGVFDVGYTGELVLALETDAGWFATKPLVDLSGTGLGGVSVNTTSLVLRARDLLTTEGREVVVEIAIETIDSDLGINEVSVDTQNYVVVCSAGSPPACMQMTSSWTSERSLIDPKLPGDKDQSGLYNKRGELYLGFLPGDLVSISSPADARAQDLVLRGIYAWPR